MGFQKGNWYKIVDIEGFKENHPANDEIADVLDDRLFYVHDIDGHKNVVGISDISGNNFVKPTEGLIWFTVYELKFCEVVSVDTNTPKNECERSQLLAEPVPEPQEPVSTPYRIRVGDTIDLNIATCSEFLTQVKLAFDIFIKLEQIGIKAGGVDVCAFGVEYNLTTNQDLVSYIALMDHQEHVRRLEERLASCKLNRLTFITE